jgi:4-carboxymuconolactone decarboxylase
MPPSDNSRRNGRLVEPVFEALDPQQQEVWLRMASGPRGKLPTPYRIWISSPEVAALFEQLGLHLLRNGAFSAREAEIAILVSAAHAGADFVLQAHRGIAVRAGLADDVVDALATGLHVELDDPREAMVQQLAGLLVRNAVVDDATFVAAQAVLGDAALAELTALLGYYAAVQMITQLYAVQPQGNG